MLYVFAPQWLPSMKWPFWGDFLELESLENIAFVKIHLPMSIRRLFKQVNGIRKSADSRPSFLKPSRGPSLFRYTGELFFEKKVWFSFRSTVALPNRRPIAKVGPEGSQNLRNINISVFLVFDLWRWMVLFPLSRCKFRSGKVSSEAQNELRTLEGSQKKKHVNATSGLAHFFEVLVGRPLWFLKF